MEQELSLFEDLEKVERAKKRGKAWLCLHCFNNSQKRWVDIKCRVEDHIMKYHLALEEVPFYCKLCWFRCQRQDQLVGHVTKYKRHIELATQGQVTDHSSYLIKNSQPHVMGPLDYSPLTAEESLKHFLGIRQDSQESSPQRQKVAAATLMTESPQADCLTITQAEPVQSGIMHAANELTTQSAEPVQSTMVQPPLGTVAGLDLESNLLNEGQAASTQLTQMLSNILSNQQFLLATYQASLATGMSSLPVQGVATPTATIQEETKKTSNITVAKDPEEVSKVSHEDETSVVKDASFTEDNKQEETEEDQVIESEPVSQTSQQSESHQVMRDGLDFEMPSISRKAVVLNEQQYSQEPEIKADSQSEESKKIQAVSVRPTVPTPDVVQPLDLSMNKSGPDHVIPEQANGGSEKVNADVNVLTETEQPVDYSLGKAVESSVESTNREVVDGVSELEKRQKEEKQSASATDENRTLEIDSDREMTVDTRNVVMTSKTIEEYVPQYVPTPVEQLKEIKDKKDQDPRASVESLNKGKDENVLDDILQDEDMTISSPKKRGIEKEDRQTNYKRRKQDHSNTKLPVDIQGLSESTLVTVVDIFRIVMETNAVAVRKMEEKLTENTVMCKLIDGVTRLKNSIDEHEKEERRREDRRRDFENRREEERRRDISRWREEERSREEWRREAERKEQEERRRKEEKAVDKDKSDKRKENQGDERAVLNDSNNKQVERRGRRW